MNKRCCLWLVVAALIFCFKVESPAQCQINKIASDHISITIDSLNKGAVKVLQLTDLHLGDQGKWKDDSTTFRRIRRLVEMHDPDLLALTGDVFAGKAMAAIVIRHFDKLRRPWLYVFGNHDAEGDIDRDGIHEAFSNSEWGILGYHQDSSVTGRKYDYCVDISLKGDSVPHWQIYGLDTGPHEGIKAIQPSQTAWYKAKSKESKELYGNMPRAISIFHIPLIQYQYLWDDQSLHKEGESREKVWYEKDDGSCYEAFVEVGNIEATFCGHDHYNNYWGEYKGGIILSYGYISGEATNEAWPTGGKLIKLPLDQREIQIRNVVPVFECERTGRIEHILEKFHDANSEYVMVAAHRAAHKMHPENSISAINHAIELGVDIVELDVKISRDGIPVLMHDGSVDRTTNGSGKVEDHTLSVLKTLRLKMPDGTLTGEKIPTFEEALEAIKGNIMVDIDLKTDDVRPIVETVKRTGTEAQVFYFDSDYDVLQKVLELEKNSMIMPRAYSCEMADSALKRFAPRVVHIDPSFYTPEVTRLIRRHNARIWINALGIPDARIRKGNVENAMEKLLRYDANIIQTDEPEILLKYLDEKELINMDDGHPAHETRMPDRGICAHRGAMDTHPENTLAAFREAVRLGAHMIEFDVRMTADGHLVIMHDETVNRTSYGHGKVSELSLEEIRQLDAGSWKSEKFAGETIPTFEEVLALMPENIWLNVHIKGGEELGKKIAGIIAYQNREHQAFLACGGEAARGAKKICPDIMICNMDRQDSREAYIGESIRQESQFIQLLERRTGRDLDQEIARLKQHHIQVNYCCTNNVEDMEVLLNKGVDFILTDRLSEMLEEFKRLK